MAFVDPDTEQKIVPMLGGTISLGSFKFGTKKLLNKKEKPN